MEKRLRGLLTNHHVLNRDHLLRDVDHVKITMMSGRLRATSSRTFSIPLRDRCW